MTLNIVFSLQTAYTVPILAFAFVCHPEVLPIYSELKEYVSVEKKLNLHLNYGRFSFLQVSTRYLFLEAM